MRRYLTRIVPNSPALRGILVEYRPILVSRKGGQTANPLKMLVPGVQFEKI